MCEKKLQIVCVRFQTFCERTKLALCHDDEKLYFRGNRYTDTCTNDSQNKLAGLTDYWQTRTCTSQGDLEDSVCHGELALGDNFSVQVQEFQGTKPSKNRKYLVVMKRDLGYEKTFWHKKHVNSDRLKNQHRTYF